MLAELRRKSQITIPREIVLKLGLEDGDQMDITEHDGTIYMIPVAVYPRKYVEELRAEVEDVKRRIVNGEQPIFDNIDAMFERLEDV